MYKTDIEKGSIILECISPPIILLNGGFGIGKTYFSEQFKKKNFSVMNLPKDKNFESIVDIDKIQNVLKNRKNFDHYPIIIEANISDENIISKIFSGNYQNFTYVFMYPNNSKNYRANIQKKLENNEYPMEIKELFEEYKINNNINIINKITLFLLNKNKEIFKRHLEFFEDKLFTILI